MRRYEKSFGWCPWPESNQHSLRNSILSRARLPIPPQGLSDIGQEAEKRLAEADVAKPAEYSGRALPVNPRVARSARGAGRQKHSQKHSQEHSSVIAPASTAPGVRDTTLAP